MNTHVTLEKEVRPRLSQFSEVFAMAMHADRMAIPPTGLNYHAIKFRFKVQVGWRWKRMDDWETEVRDEDSIVYRKTLMNNPILHMEFRHLKTDDFAMICFRKIPSDENYLDAFYFWDRIKDKYGIKNFGEKVTKEEPFVVMKILHILDLSFCCRSWRFKKG
jgi:hypothetical protein